MYITTYANWNLNENYLFLNLQNTTGSFPTFLFHLVPPPPVASSPTYCPPPLPPNPSAPDVDAVILVQQMGVWDPKLKQKGWLAGWTV